MKAAVDNETKHRANSLVYWALQSGKIVKKPCEVCGRHTVEAHHADYSQPLVVKWLCREHHTEAHVQMRKGTLRVPMLIHLSPETKAAALKLADLQNRSLTNLIETLLQDACQKYGIKIDRMGDGVKK
jgi:hypothetical protein